LIAFYLSCFLNQKCIATHIHSIFHFLTHYCSHQSTHHPPHGEDGALFEISNIEYIILITHALLQNHNCPLGLILSVAAEQDEREETRMMRERETERDSKREIEKTREQIHLRRK
jgi:uncharacterized membrane protein YozB (DUF420 family)